MPYCPFADARVGAFRERAHPGVNRGKGRGVTKPAVCKRKRRRG